MPADIEADTATSIRELGREMVRLDVAAQRALEHGRYAALGPLAVQRLAVQEQRSELLRMQWTWRRAYRHYR